VEFDIEKQGRSAAVPIHQAGGRVRPWALAFSPAAHHAWIAFYDATEARVRPGGEYDAVCGLANKQGRPAS
jgi:hypothetical protein